MVDFTKATYVLPTYAVAATIDFYTRVLGMTREREEGDWVFLTRGSLSVMVGMASDALPDPPEDVHPYYVYITVDDFDALYKELVAANVPIAQEPRNLPWGIREFGIQTPDGRQMMFSGPIV